MMHAIARNGNAKQRADALNTMSTDTTFRTLRASLQLLNVRPARRVNPLMGEANKQRSIYSANQTERSSRCS